MYVKIVISKSHLTRTTLIVKIKINLQIYFFWKVNLKDDCIGNLKKCDALHDALMLKNGKQKKLNICKTTFVFLVSFTWISRFFASTACLFSLRSTSLPSRSYRVAPFKTKKTFKIDNQIHRLINLASGWGVKANLTYEMDEYEYGKWSCIQH